MEAINYLSSKEQLVFSIFRRIAPRYDLVNTIVSFGRHHSWRKFMVDKAGLSPGQRVLDVCCGTGLITKDLAARVEPLGKVVGLDLSPEMLAVAQKNLENFPHKHLIQLVQGNAMALPFPEGTFDCVTIGYGLRNVTDLRQTLRELFRVLKPGGKVVSLELAKPSPPLFNKIYHLYMATFLPFIGTILTRHKEAYLYLHRSVVSYPHQHEITRLFTEVGFHAVTCSELSWGLAAVHVGFKP
ncbi:MAG: bifunctional demethylmenaquinone methyltransferase/2-methoxy-6-polyprenyl-1,4-benzoquinol methylase UbiE [Firmicutes bacterium]|nr:bifunctional demethylmenaquinone methyltransferase/2-methoxy-6-polyprenyl-1,4-benzoquinol methylase UbiE [Bacillota bacterium]